MRIVYFGTPEFAVEALDAICGSAHDVATVVTVPDRLSGRGQKVTASAVKQYALAHNLPILQPEKLRDETFLGTLRAIDADAFVVVAFRMLPQVVWGMPRLGTFNLHASLLPDYRGAAPINWAIINGEHQTGVTTFMLNERIDEGSILLQRTTPIAPTDNAGSLHDRLAQMGRTLVVETLDAMANGSLTPHPQNTVGTLHTAPKIFKADCAIDFNKSAHDIVNLIRGLSPYPAATMRMVATDGAVADFKVYEAVATTGPAATPGTTLSDGKKYLKIATTDGYVDILSLQMSGKKRISTPEFLRGFDITNWETAE